MSTVTPNTKQAAIEIISALPDNCTYDDIYYHLYVREKVERGMEAYRRGEFLSQDEAEQETREWLKSIGQERPNPT